MKITMKKAFADAEKKWVYLSEFDYRKEKSSLVAEKHMVKRYPSLEKYAWNCSFCELYNEKVGCTGCPLAINTFRSPCRHRKHPFDIWNFNPTCKNARRVLALIRKKKKEYENQKDQ